MNFCVIVCDGNGGVSMDSITVLVDNIVGLFMVIMLAININVDGGLLMIIDWNVVNIDSGNVNCSVVDFGFIDVEKKVIDVVIVKLFK